jgi:ACS family tartrate transporter-like MFS transporter
MARTRRSRKAIPVREKKGEETVSVLHSVGAVPAHISSAEDAFGDQVVNKVITRIVPFVLICYLINQIDRVNVSFGALTMNRDFGFTAEIFGFGAGIFFIGYFLFEVPSNLIMHKVGARRWIARIMITWGAVSIGMAFITGPMSFYIMRFLLGVAEAGFVPGVFLYFTYWVPEKYCARALGIFIVAAPLTPVIAGPLSTTLLEMDGIMGLRGWQWLYITEGAPAILLAFVTYFYLTDRPSEAKWLTDEERRWLEARLDSERAATERAGGSHSMWDGMRSPTVLLLTCMYLALVIGLLGLVFFLPQIVRGFGLTNLQVGFVSAIPYLFAVLGCLWWPIRSDRIGERHWHFAAPCFLGAAAFVVAAYLGASWLALVPISIAITCAYASLPVFWAIPNQYLTGLAAASGLAFINSFGNLGGFIGPFMVGWLRSLTGNFVIALLCLSSGLLVAGVLTFLLPRQRLVGDQPPEVSPLNPLTRG